MKYPKEEFEEMGIVAKLFTKIYYFNKKNEKKIEIAKESGSAIYHTFSFLFEIIKLIFTVVVALLKPILILFALLAIFDI